MKIIDLGWNRIISELKKADKSYTKVGVQEGAKSKDMSDLVIVAAANEFGTKRIPERSFIRSTFDEQKRTLYPIIEKQYDKVLAGSATVKLALSFIGMFLVAKTQQKIVDTHTPPNAPSTIRRKGSSHPLIDTGQLRQSIRNVEVIQ